MLDHLAARTPATDRSPRGQARRRIAAATAGLLAATGLLATAAPAHAALPGSTEQVIVTASGPLSALSAISQIGGSELANLSIIGGLEATIPTSAVGVLSSLPGIEVTPDATVDVTATTAPPTRQPAAVFPQATGASQLWAAGDDGSGVNVAVLDTGIDPLPDFAGRMVGGVDLTGAGNPWLDSYGHGTFVAGLIAGNGASSGGQYLGEAPGAGLVSVKVAGASGLTDLATVIEGVQWAVSEEAPLGIRVLNVSLGVQPTESTVLDPLDQAVEAAWHAGITVVTSAGNAGPFNGTILSPGDDPLVITAGALDDLGTAAPADDTVPAFSSVGPTSPDGWLKPDLVASGRSVISLRDPGSTIDTQWPGARIGTGNFVGSGTSFSAAITSGAAALVLAAHPLASPAEVKGRLLGTTQPGPVGDPFVDGHGALDAASAVDAPAVSVLQSTAGEGATAVGATVSLAATWAASTWDPAAWTTSPWTGSAWNGSAWNGSAWNGSAWNGSAWNGSAWNGSAWNGSAWNGSAWNGSAWNGSAWNGSAWNGSAWNGSAWNGSAWGS